MDKPRPALTSRDLARLAGVSQSTVSRVLTNHPKVSAETRARVLQVLEEQDYSPNALARAMRTGRTDTVGVFVTRVTSPLHAALLDAIGRKLSAAGLQMILWNLQHDPYDAATQVIRQRLADGFIFTSALLGDSPDKIAVRAGVPTVLLHRGVEGLECDQVVGDNWRGSWDAGHYLHAAGHRRIGLIGMSLGTSTARDREAGFRAALAAKGLEIKPKYVVRGGLDHGDGHKAVQELMKLPKPPTAIYAGTDLLALGALDGARSLGVKVPDDLWVIGFDNVDMAAWESFSLTSVDQPVEAIVDTGIELLRKRIADPTTTPVVKKLPCVLVPRGSTADTPVGDLPAPPRGRRRLSFD
jgi:LacI family transcriptional regulator, galactose operon repressor